MAEQGNILIFADGQRCMVVNNTLSKGAYENGSYNSWDESRLLLVNIDTGKVELHYRNNIPYEHGELYIPIWGGVSKVIKNIDQLIK